jgi:hypothetical protein
MIPAVARPRETTPDQRIALRRREAHACSVEEPLMERSEIVALLFNVSDISATLAKIERLLGGGEDAAEEADEG